MKRQFDTVRFSDVLDAYARINPTGTWFSPERIKASKMNSPIMAYDVPTGWLFITSEPGEDKEIRFTTRRMSRAGEIFTIGHLNQYVTRHEASEALMLIAKGY